MALCLYAVAGGGTYAQAEDDIAIRATAGLGGFVKSGRWAPVQIEIDHRGSESTADVVVVWGDASVRRRVFFGSPGTRRLELYIRTADAESVMHVSVNAEADRIEVPVTVLPYDASVTLCVSDAYAWFNESSRCSVTLAPQQLPSSARGYEIVDDVILAGGPGAMSAIQAGTLERWRSLRSLETAGDLSLTPQVTRPVVRRGLPSASAAAVTRGAVVYLACLVVVGLLAATTRRPPSRAWVAFAVVLASATGAALVLGHAGPGSQITIHHTSLLQQIPGASGSLLTMRGTAEFPSDEHVRLRAPVEDAMIEAVAASGRAEQVIDEDGRPVLEGRYGLGTRQAFATEALVDVEWLAVAEDSRTVRVANRSNMTLRDCRFADGMSVTTVGDLPAGATVSAERQSDIVGPLFTCIASASAVALSVPSHPIEMKGTTTIAVYQTRTLSTSAPETPND